MLTGCLLVIYKYIDTPANGLTILRFLTWHLFNPAEIRFSKHFLWCHSKPTRNTMSYYDDDYECRFCTRYFGSQRALNSHCRSKHVWCERCYRAFSTVSAKKAHFRQSNAHNVCGLCIPSPDFSSGRRLDDHLVSAHHICLTCDIRYDSSKQLDRHDVVVHNLCITCGEYFTNPNNLRMVLVDKSS